MYTVQESVGQVVLTVLVVPDENKVIPEISIPLGVRVTSRSGSATGKKHKFYERYSYGLFQLSQMLLTMSTFSQLYTFVPMVANMWMCLLLSWMIHYLREKSVLQWN